MRQANETNDFILLVSTCQEVANYIDLMYINISFKFLFIGNTSYRTGFSTKEFQKVEITNKIDNFC